MINDATIKLAREFGHQLQCEFDDIHTIHAIIDQNNASGDIRACCADDWCDANQVMLNAFAKTFDRDADPINEADYLLMDTARVIAKEADYYI